MLCLACTMALMASGENCLTTTTQKASQRNKEAKMSNLNKQTKKKKHKRTDDGWGALMTQS